MQEILNIINEFNVVNILVVAFVTTIIVSAINMIENKINDGWLVFGIGAFLTFLRTSFQGFDNTVAGWQNLCFQFITTSFFAFLFVRKLGGWFTETLFGSVKNYISDKIKNNTPSGDSK